MYVSVEQLQINIHILYICWLRILYTTIYNVNDFYATREIERDNTKSMSNTKNCFRTQ